MLNAFEIDKQCVHVILWNNVKNMKKEMDDMEVPSMGCVSHTLQLAAHEGLLSQCSITHSHVNTRKVEANVAIAYTAWMQILFFLIEAVLSRKMKGYHVLST